jgi:hypothetical protein
MFEQTVKIDNITATVRIIGTAGNAYQVDAEFSSPSYPVGCLSVYRDLRYQLRDSANRIVPIDAETLKHPPYEMQTITHMTRHGPPNIAL